MTDWTINHRRLLLAPQPPASVPPTGQRTDDARGRTRAIGVVAVMGLIWAFSALSRLSSAVAVPGLVGSVAIFAALTTGARRRLAGAGPVPTSDGPEATHPAKVRRRFIEIGAAELAAIVASAVILAGFGLSVWIPAAICAVVGLHFIPLARIFRVPTYYATATALCLVAVTTLILGTTGATGSLVRTLPCLGAALSLWATGAGLLLARPAHRP